MNILFTLCGRAGSKGVKGKNARDFLDVPLVWYSMANIALYIEKYGQGDDIKVVLNTDSKDFGGNGLADDSVVHFTVFDPAYVEEHKEWLKLYIPARSAVVLKKN